MKPATTGHAPERFRVRQAAAADCNEVAALHIANMQETYSSFLSAGYLTNEMPAERRARWASRFGLPQASQHLTLVAEGQSGKFAGFVCLVLDPADRWGVLIDSLHIDPACRGQGLGRHLLRSAIAELEAVHMARPMHLLVYEENFDARRLYDALKGKIVERLPRDIGRCGTVLLFRYHWASSASLADALR